MLTIISRSVLVLFVAFTLGACAATSQEEVTEDGRFSKNPYEKAADIPIVYASEGNTEVVAAKLSGSVWSGSGFAIANCTNTQFTLKIHTYLKDANRILGTIDGSCPYLNANYAGTIHADGSVSMHTTNVVYIEKPQAKLGKVVVTDGEKADVKKKKAERIIDPNWRDRQIRLSFGQDFQRATASFKIIDPDANKFGLPRHSGRFEMVRVDNTPPIAQK